MGLFKYTDQFLSIKKALLVRIMIILATGGFFPLAGDVVANLWFPEFRLITLPLHSAFEVAGGFAAIILAIMIMLFRYDLNQYPRMWMASGLLSMGLFDTIHGCVQPGNLFVWLHSLAVFFGGLFFFLIWYQPPHPSKRQMIFIPISIFVITLTISIISLIAPSWVPAMAENGAFTTAAKALNFSGGIFFLIASLIFLFRYFLNKIEEDFLFSLLCVLFGIAGLLFQQSALWDFAWWFWHFLRLLAYLVIIGYVFVIYKSNSDEIETANIELDKYFNISTDGKVIIDKNFNIQRLNNTMKEILEIDNLDIASRKCYEILQTAICNTEDCPIHQSQTGMESIESEITINASGSTKTCQFVFAPLLNNKGRFTGIIESFVDITEQKEMMSRLEADAQQKAALAELSLLIRGKQTKKELAEIIIQFLAKKTNAKQGVLYRADHNEKQLIFTAGYAYKPGKNDQLLPFEKCFSGQAIIDQDILHLTNVPDYENTIHSSLGSASPKHIIACPFIFNNNIIGTIELGSFEPFSDFDIRFLKESMETIAIAISIAKNDE